MTSLYAGARVVGEGEAVERPGWGQRLAWFDLRGCPCLYLSGSFFLSLSTHRLCGILEGGVPGHLAHYFPPQSGPGHKPHGAGLQTGLLPIHYSLSCQAGTGVKRNYEALPSPNSVPGPEWRRVRCIEHTRGGEAMPINTLWWWKGCLCLGEDC